VVLTVNCYPELVETYDHDEYHLYGLWRLQIGGKDVDVGCVIGVRESDRDTAKKGHSGNRCFLAAWYADSSDWSTHEERDIALEIMTEHVQYLAREHGIA
jgi:hypothetical protein